MLFKDFETCTQQKKLTSYLNLPSCHVWYANQVPRMAAIAAGTPIAIAIMSEVVSGSDEVDDGEEGVDVDDDENGVDVDDGVVKAGVVTVTGVPGVAVNVG
jgi:hypothetical protein